MDSIKIIKDRAVDMIRADEHNTKMFQAMWDMWNMNWTMPPNLTQHKYIRKQVAPDPHDAIRVGTQVLASVMPTPSINSLVPTVQTREKFDKLERAISWLFRIACQRKGNPLADIVRHALLFDRVAVQVVYLPNQMDVTKVFQGEKHREEYALRYGPFAIVVRDPRNVHAEWSEFMPERVLYKYVAPVHEVISFWGEKASKLKNKKANEKYDGYEYVTVYDYHDLEQRRVWAILQNNDMRLANPTDGDTAIILSEKNKLDFLPWVVRDGGEQLDPILLPVWKTNLWEDMNLYETLMSSEIIAYSAAPKIIKESFNPDSITVDYGQVGASIDHQPGESVTPFLPPQIDINISSLLDRLQGRMAKSTVPNVIQSVDFPAEWAYATLNLAVQSGIKVLTPARELSQRVLSDVFRQMFYWIDYSGDTVVAYPTRQQIEQPEPIEGALGIPPPILLRNQVEQVEISPDDFDVKHMYIDVELEVDIPSDKMGRVNAAATLNERLWYTKRQALEDVGVPDPGAMIDEWEEERRRESDLNIELMENQERAMTDVLVEREEKLNELRQEAAQQAQPQNPPIADNTALGGQPFAQTSPGEQAQAKATAGTQIPLGVE
jgi:hypothetical protein